MTEKRSRPYVPSTYQTCETEARQMVRDQPFAMIVTGSNRVIEATQTPLFFENDSPDCAHVIGHIARANPQAQDLMNKGSALAVFNGASAYVSPNWYVENMDVPTWIYQAVHLRGALSPVPAGAKMRALMENIIAQSERRIGGRWTLDQIPESSLNAMMLRIIGFRIEIASLVGISKMEQSHSAANRNSVAAALQHGSEIGRADLAAALK